MTLPVLDVEFLFAVTATPSGFYDCGGLGRNEFRLNGTYERLGLSQAETDIARLQFLCGPTDDQYAVGSCLAASICELERHQHSHTPLPVFDRTNLLRNPSPPHSF